MKLKLSIPLIFFVGFGYFATFVCADEKAAPQQSEVIAALIRQLASPNRPPYIDESGHYSLPKTFDRAAQIKVHRAWDELKRQGTSAIPQLIDHLDDERYCTTVASPLSDFWHNRTVGEAAREIVASQLRPYGPWQYREDDEPINRASPRPNYAHTFFNSKESAKQWWSERPDRSLQALQLEVLEWTIAEEAKSPDRYSHQERRHLNSLRDMLRDRSLPPGNSEATYRIGEDY